MNKITAERNQRALLELASQPGNDVCADCKAKNPRWTSHNLGIFICVSCASIHRKIGTHITKVKSITLDQWTKEQVEMMRQKGNVKSNYHYNPNEARHPPPANMIDSERDSELEKYIRAKYEFKSFVDKSAQVTAMLGPSRSLPRKLSPALPARSQTASVSSTSSPSPSIPPPVPAKTPVIYSDSARQSFAAPSQSQTPAPFIPSSASALSTQSQGFLQTTQNQPQKISNNPVLSDLASLQYPTAATNSTLPLQYLSTGAMQSVQPTRPMAVPSSSGNTFLTASNAYRNLATGSPNPFPSSPGSFTGISPSSNMGLSYGTGLSPGMSIPGLSAFQSHQSAFGGPSSMYTPTAAPIQSPFAPQPLQPGMGGGAIQHQPSPQPFLPYSSSPSNQPLVQSTTPQPSSMFQPQSLTSQPSLQYASFQAQMMPQQNVSHLQSQINPLLQQQQQQQQQQLQQQQLQQQQLQQQQQQLSQFATPGFQSPMPYGQQGFSSGAAFGTGVPQGHQGAYPGQQWRGM